MVEESLYEQLFALTTIMKQRVVDNFDGDSLNERWRVRNITGVGSATMVDAVDEGLQVVTGGGISDQTAIDFNDIRHYSNIASVMLMIAKRTSTIVNTNHEVGLAEDASSGSLSGAWFLDSTTQTFKRGHTGDGTTGSELDTSIAIDTLFKSYKVECRSADVLFSISDVLEITKTTNLPVGKMQPYMKSLANTNTGARLTNIRYLEVFNK